jgi:hypothetical protein
MQSHIARIHGLLQVENFSCPLGQSIEDVLIASMQCSCGEGQLRVSRFESFRVAVCAVLALTVCQATSVLGERVPSDDPATGRDFLDSIGSCFKQLAIVTRQHTNVISRQNIFIDDIRHEFPYSQSAQAQRSASAIPCCTVLAELRGALPRPGRLLHLQLLSITRTSPSSFVSKSLSIPSPFAAASSS